MNNTSDYLTLKHLQSMSLPDKIELSKLRIREWYEEWNGNVYVSISGGKDSDVVLHIVRSIYPNILAVFCDTGLEYPENKAHIRKIDNVEIIRPKKTFKQVIEQHGYPVISKENAHKIYDIRHTKSEKLRCKRLHGDPDKWNTGKLPEKWKFLIDAPFKITDYCCNVLKKNPFKCYDNKTGRKGILGVMAEDSRFRLQSFIRYGCNSFTSNRPTSRPIIFWKNTDVWDYIKNFNVSYSKIYNMGYHHTGCIFCMFGIGQEEKETGTNRFKLMKQTHPKLWKYCINKLHIKEVMNFCGYDVDVIKRRSYHDC